MEASLTLAMTVQDPRTSLSILPRMVGCLTLTILVPVTPVWVWIMVLVLACLMVLILVRPTWVRRTPLRAVFSTPMAAALVAMIWAWELLMVACLIPEISLRAA